MKGTNTPAKYDTSKRVRRRTEEKVASSPSPSSSGMITLLLYILLKNGLLRCSFKLFQLKWVLVNLRLRPSIDLAVGVFDVWIQFYASS